jgi:GR25 family glycosyltransferase involved in LPS biosynthesis
VRPVRVINLLRHAERREAFRERNGHVPVEFFDAVDGGQFTAEQVTATGLFSPEVLTDYGAHGVGCALSHWTLWNEAARGTEPLTIAEDDAVWRNDFEERADEVLASLPQGWDIVLWGWNFDTILQVYPMQGVSPVVMIFDQEKLRGSLDVFQTLGEPVRAWRMERAFGLLTYTLSPAGAKKLIERCFPQKPFSLWLAGLNYNMRNMGVDVSANAVYAQVQAYACFPPIAASPNRR